MAPDLRVAPTEGDEHGEGDQLPHRDTDPIAGEVVAEAVRGQEPATSDRDGWLDDVPLALQDLSRACLALGTNPYLAALLVGAAREQLAVAGYPEFTITCAPSFLSEATHAQITLAGE